jgi:hypothetical protein
VAPEVQGDVLPAEREAMTKRSGPKPFCKCGCGQRITRWTVWRKGRMHDVQWFSLACVRRDRNSLREQRVEQQFRRDLDRIKGRKVSELEMIALMRTVYHRGQRSMMPSTLSRRVA